MPLQLKPLVHKILEHYALPWNGTHGVGHWARVLENGVRLAEAMGVSVEIVQLFAVFHDARRINEYEDWGHGRRGAELAAELRGRWFQLPDEEFQLLCDACAGHTEGRTVAKPTVQVCWDADRLDLGRVGVTPQEHRLCTSAARQPQILQWADAKATLETVPAFVREEWEIDLAG